MDDKANSSNIEPKLYYEDCLKEAMKLLKTQDNTKLYMDATALRFDIISTGESMTEAITFEGCRKIMLTCCKAMYLAHNKPFQEEIFTKIVFHHVEKVFETNLVKIVSTAIFSNKSYNSDDFFHAFDLFINLYYAFGNNEFLDLALEFFDWLAIESCNIIPLDSFSPFKKIQIGIYYYRFQNMKKDPWIPPKTNFDNAPQMPQPSEQNKSGGCYIATAVYGSYESPQVLVLRKFRDNYLSNRKWGKKFISFYYTYSPKYANKLKRSRCINWAVRKILDLFVSMLSKKK